MPHIARAIRGPLALVILAALAGCQAEPSGAVTGRGGLGCPNGWYVDCRLATLHNPHFHLPHRHHLKAALRRSVASPTRRDVDAIIEGMRRAKAEPHLPPSPADSTP